ASSVSLYELLVERILLVHGEHARQILVPEPELPIADHVRGKRGTDHVEGRFDTLPQSLFESRGGIRHSIVDERPEVGRRKPSVPEIQENVSEPLPKRESMVSQRRRVLEQCPNGPIALAPREELERRRNGLASVSTMLS